MDRSAVLAEIVKRLSPYLGATMAEASARAQCEKLGFVSQAISGAQAETLLGKLGAGLAVFVGREKSATVMRELRDALVDLEPAR
jgi:hypothetical protein